jgi:hypothetical protein
MDERHNLFEYADRELSQDGFLLWLLNNFDSEEEDVRFFSNGFIAALCGPSFPKEVKITAIETWAQWKKIDVLAEITLENGEKHLLAIEDKTFSDVHSRRGKDETQLAYYNHCLDDRLKDLQIPDANCHKVFYKTSSVSKEEEKEVRQAQWGQKDLKGIISVFAQLTKDCAKPIGNAILDAYLGHLEKISHQTYDLPENTASWGKVGWNNYLEETLVPAFAPEKNTQIRWCGYRFWNGIYMWVAFAINCPTLKKIYEDVYPDKKNEHFLNLQLSMDFRFSDDGHTLQDVWPKLKIRKEFLNETEEKRKHRPFDSSNHDDQKFIERVEKFLVDGISPLFKMTKWKSTSYTAREKINTETRDSVRSEIEKYVTAINRIGE